MVLFSSIVAITAAMGVQQPIAAQTAQPLLECRLIVDNIERLACYDSAVDALRPEENERLAIVDLNRIEAVERDGFGLPMPSMPDLSSVFATRDELGLSEDSPSQASITSQASQADPSSTSENENRSPDQVAPVTDSRVLERSDDGQIDRIELVISSVASRGYDGATIEMANGQVWRVLRNAETLLRRTDPGDTAEIRRGAAGSYLLRVNASGRAYRVQRLQ